MSLITEITIERDRSYFPVKVCIDRPNTGMFDGVTKERDREYTLTETEEKEARVKMQDETEVMDEDFWRIGR